MTPHQSVIYGKKYRKFRRKKIRLLTKNKNLLKTMMVLYDCKYNKHTNRNRKNLRKIKKSRRMSLSKSVVRNSMWRRIKRKDNNKINTNTNKCTQV